MLWIGLSSGIGIGHLMTMSDVTGCNGDRRGCAPACGVVPFWNEAGRDVRTLAAPRRAGPTGGLHPRALVDYASSGRERGRSGGAPSRRRPRSSTCAWCTSRARAPARRPTPASATPSRRGARWVARTDADCLPHRHWVAACAPAVEGDGLAFVAGVIRPRTDEGPLPWHRRAALRAMIALAERWGRLHRRGPQFRYPYFMAAGNNPRDHRRAVRARRRLPAHAIEEAHEDRALSERVRTLTDRAAVRRDVIVYNSARRVRAWGCVNTLRWYRNHGYRPAVVDVR
jgi:hypothetical protein